MILEIVLEILQYRTHNAEIYVIERCEDIARRMTSFVCSLRPDIQTNKKILFKI